MYHVQIRMGMQVARAFNLSADEVRTRWLVPLAGDEPFIHEGHEWEPRKTRILIYEAPELEPHQLGMGRGWANVERSGADVTRTLLERPPAALASGEPQAGADAPPPLVELLRQRLIGRLTAGPVTIAEILTLAADLIPEGGEQQRLAAGRAAAWELLRRGEAQLVPSDR